MERSLKKSLKRKWVWNLQFQIDSRQKETETEGPIQVDKGTEVLKDTRLLKVGLEKGLEVLVVWYITCGGKLVGSPLSLSCTAFF